MWSIIIIIQLLLLFLKKFRILWSYGGGLTLSSSIGRVPSRDVQVYVVHF